MIIIVIFYIINVVIEIIEFGLIENEDAFLKKLASYGKIISIISM